MSTLKVPIRRDDHHLGPVDAPLTLIEYGDFECPACGAAYPEVKRLQEALADRLCFIFRHFPLMHVHPNAESAAEAAESAATTGRFWPMHDLLFEHQDALDLRSLASYGRSVGMDPDVVVDDIRDRVHLSAIHKDFLGGVRSGVNGTPGFFINGIKYEGRATAEDLLAGMGDVVKSGRHALWR